MLTPTDRSLSLKLQTQNALRVVNEYEKIKKFKMMITTLSTSINERNIKEFIVQEKIKVQLLPNSLAYYQLFLNSNVDNKIIIRHFKGGSVQIFLFYDKLAKDLDKATHHFVIKSQIILKLQQKQFKNASSIIIVFKSDRNLSMFTFRIDNLRIEKKKKDLLRGRSLQQIRKIQFQEQQLSIQKILRSKSEKKMHQRMLLAELDYSLKETHEEKQKKLQLMKEINEEKMEAAKKRVQNIQIYKEISRQAEKIVVSCRKQIVIFEQLLKKEKQAQKQVIQNYTPFFSLIKFCQNFTQLFNEKQLLKKKALTIKRFQKKFIRSIKSSYQQTKKLQPNLQERQLLVLSMVTNSVAHCLYRVSRNQAQPIVIQTINNLFSGLLINLAMGQAVQYKRVVRGVQRKWKSRFQTRTAMLMMFAQQQLQSIIGSHPQLQAVEKWFRENNKEWTLCLQYQKEVAERMVDFISVYQFKLQEIAEYIKMNKQMIESYRNNNDKKKILPQLLNIPSKPPFPVFRFFRDLQFLKSLIRGQLQLEFRKYKKKNFHLFQLPISSSPEKQKKKCGKKFIK